MQELHVTLVKINMRQYNVPNLDNICMSFTNADVIYYCLHLNLSSDIEQQPPFGDCK